LHLNGYKISNPTLLARIEHDELEQFLRGCGWRSVRKVWRERKDRRTGSSQLQKEMRGGPSVSAGRGRHQTMQCCCGSKDRGGERLL